MSEKTKEKTIKNYIQDHINTTLILRQKLPNELVKLICSFSEGFICRDGLILYVHGRVSHQIRYMHGLLFMDFWKFKEFYKGSAIFDDHYAFEYLTSIYNPIQNKLYTDCYKFYRRYQHPRPLYKLKKITREHFKHSDADSSEFAKLNMNELYEYVLQKHIKNTTKNKRIKLN